jgi:hypothetical protein
MAEQVQRTPRRFEAPYGFVEWEETEDGAVIKIHILKGKAARAAVYQQLAYLLSQLGGRTASTYPTA